MAGKIENESKREIAQNIVFNNWNSKQLIIVNHMTIMYAEFDTKLNKTCVFFH